MEVLVTIVVIGIIVGSATLMFGDPGKDEFTEEKDRLATLINLAQEEAVMQSRDYGIGFWEDGYGFFEYTGMVDENNQPVWPALEDDDMLRKRKLPKGMQLKLALEGIDIVMSAVEVDKPQVFILSSGEMSPFKLTMSFDDRLQTTIDADALGNLEVAEIQDKKP